MKSLEGRTEEIEESMGGGGGKGGKRKTVGERMAAAEELLEELTARCDRKAEANALEVRVLVGW